MNADNTETPKCLNCNRPLNGPVCSSCGQKQAFPIETKRVAIDIWSQFIDLDFKFARALRHLITSPGLMIKEYIQGRRIAYTNPFKLLFLTATIYYLLVIFLDIPTNIGFGLEEKAEEAEKAGRSISTLLNYLIFVILIPSAAVFRWIYAKNQYNFAESYVAVCFIWSGFLIWGIPFALLSPFFDVNFLLVRTLVGVIYLLIATKQLFGLSYFSAMWKSILFYLGFFIASFLVILSVFAFAFIIGIEPLMIRPEN
jgi:hypothetical protein